MSTKTQKLTNSRESVTVQRTPSGVTRIIDTSSTHPPSLQQRYGHLYPMLASVVVVAVLYGIYSSTYQPEPVAPIKMTQPIGYALLEKLKNGVYSYFGLLQKRFDELKEVGPKPAETGVCVRDIDSEMVKMRPNVHHPHPVDDSIRYLTSPQIFNVPPHQHPRYVENQYQTVREHIMPIKSAPEIVGDKIKDVIYTVEEEGKEFLKEVEDSAFKLKQKIMNEPESIKKEVDLILKEAESMKLRFVDEWKSKTEHTFEDLQQLKYKMQDRYRESRDTIYRTGEQMLGHLSVN
eukprot:gene1382-1745_t